MITTNPVPTPHLAPFGSLKAEDSASKGPSTVSQTVGIRRTLKEGMSDRGAWNKAQLALIGIAWPPMRGWRSQLSSEGFRVSADVHSQFVALRNQLIKPQRNRTPECLKLGVLRIAL